ncbi:MAG: hypothetical protein LBP54_02985, partial [Campylobacteraceae bacterium]|nr:hypothetical protein [Campylobacteraceae bacterium]
TTQSRKTLASLLLNLKIVIEIQNFKYMKHLHTAGLPRFARNDKKLLYTKHMRHLPPSLRDTKCQSNPVIKRRSGTFFCYCGHNVAIYILVSVISLLSVMRTDDVSAAIYNL